MAMKFVGSINLSNIPKSEIKVIEKDGKKTCFLNISIHENKKPSYAADGKLISDHFISCAPKKENRDEKTNYIIGSLRTWEENASAMPSPEEIAAAPSAETEESTDLPF